MKTNRNIPLLLVVTILSLVMGAVLLFRIISQTDQHLLHQFYFGFDYYNFYQASTMVLGDQSPYQYARYVTPPVPALINIPFAFLPFAKARVLVSILAFFSVALSLYLVHRIFNSPEKRTDGMFLLWAVLLMGLSYPFYFLFDRGNIDGFVLLFLCLGLFLLGKRSALSGALFAIAISCKIYPVLILLPLMGRRYWKPFLFTIISLAVLFLLTPQMWMDYFQERLLQRSSSFRIDENGSIANTFYFIGSFFHVAEIAKRISLVVYFLLLGTVFILDGITKFESDKEFYASMAMYFPFMVAVPQLSYHYELVCILALLPVVSWLWKNSRSTGEQVLLLVIAVGIAFSQFQAVALENLIGVSFSHFIPGFGLFVILVGVTGYKLHRRFYLH